MGRVPALIDSECDDENTDDTFLDTSGFEVFADYEDFVIHDITTRDVC